MHNLRRFINQNRIQILIAVLFVAFIFMGIKFANNYYEEERIKRQEEISVVVNKTEEEVKQEKSSYSVMTGEKVSTDKTADETTVINDFVKYCNMGDYENAYNMLSLDCKEVVFPKLEYFINNYYKSMFKEQKSIDLQAWFKSNNGNTYKVTFIGDALSTGKLSDLQIEDYYTVVLENGVRKLNINSYIRRVKYNSDAELTDINIKPIYKDIFLDYEIYELEVINNTSKIIMLDTLSNSNSMYLTGTSSNAKYTAFSNEISANELKVNPSETKTIRIKFNKLYNTNVTVNAMNFTDFVKDYELYVQSNTKRETLSIKI